MSKAFTDEESSDATVPGRAPVRAAAGEARPITPAGHRALLEGLRVLREEERPAAERLPDAPVREARLAEVDRRIALAAAAVESVRVVEPPRAPDEVAFGTRVTIALGDGRRQILALVGPDEADARAGRVSVDSPLARALLGLRTGDEAEIPRPRGAESAVVERIEPMPDESAAARPEPAAP